MDAVNEVMVHARREVQRISELLDTGSINEAADTIKMLANDLNDYDPNNTGKPHCFGKKWTIKPY